jgi:acyl transferase domain-containing protein
MTEAIANQDALMARVTQALRNANTRLEEIKYQAHEPIAVIGMACRFPGAASPETFWELLRDGIDAVAPVPAARWNVDAYYDLTPGVPGKTYVRDAAMLDSVDQFDPQFFGIAPREALALDPQQRLLLEVSWEALERAGQSPAALENSQTGVYLGVGRSDYEEIMGETFLRDIYAATGNSPIFASGRLSYVLGLQGPNLVVDTACSASLISVHLACESLRNSSSDLALAGGVHLMLSPRSTIIMSQMQTLSPDGRCKTFDAAANGYGRGEGCGIVVLKRLSDAQANRDNILAVIRGSAINHDGVSSGLTVPSATAQVALIRHALANAQVAPDDVSYIEAHGTGTTLGDPIEIRALSTVFGKRATPLIVGTVKTNLGHLEEAAGIAGLMKVILAMRHNEIPPHLHFRNPNSHIDWERVNFRVPVERTAWSVEKKIAGVSSFGLGGSNAHLVIEQAPVVEHTAITRERPAHLLTLSAKTEPALRELAQRYARHLTDAAQLDLGDLCFTANHGRTYFQHRLALVLNSQNQAAQDLATFADGKNSIRLMNGQATESARKIAFLFTGQGSQYLGMGRELYETQPSFRATIDRCDAVAQTALGRSLIELIYPAAPPEHNDLMNSHPCGQAANFAIECALADLWRSWGVQPNLVLGHSLGDFAAACTAGVLSLEDGLRLVIERGRLMERARGSMVAVMASEQEVQSLVAPFADVTIGVINGSRSVVISGGQQHVAQVVERLQQAGFKTHKLDIPVAAHSPLLDPVLDEFESAVRRVKFGAPRCGVVSSMTGQRVTSELSEPGYWRRHLRNTVRFADGAQTLHAQGANIFLEIGPKPVLIGMAEQYLDSEPGNPVEENDSPLAPRPSPLFLASLREGQSDWQQMLSSLGKLYIRGIEIDWVGFDQDHPRHKVVLPTYPFQCKRYWITDKKIQGKTESPETSVPTSGSSADDLVSSDEILGNKEAEKMNTQSSQPQTFAAAQSKPSVDLATLLAQLQQAIQASPDGIDLHIDEIKGLHIRINPGSRIAKHPAGTASVEQPAQPQIVDSESPAPKRRLMPLTTNVAPSPARNSVQPSATVPTSPAPQRNDQTVSVDPANLTQTLKQLLADLLYFEDVAAIDESAKFLDLGMDSVTGVEYINMINRKFALKLKAVVLYDYSSIRDLADYLLSLVRHGNAATPAQAKPAPSANGGNGSGQTPLRELLTQVAKGELSPQASREQLAKIQGERATPNVPSATAGNQEQVLAVMRNFIAEIRPAAIEQMKPSHTFDELGLDSVDQAEIIVKTMEKLGINAPRVEFAKAKTIGGVAELVAKQLEIGK